MTFKDEMYFRTKDAIDIHNLGGVAIDEDLALDAEFCGLPTHGLREEIDDYDCVPFKDRRYQDANPFGLLDIERGGGPNH